MKKTVPLCWNRIDLDTSFWLRLHRKYQPGEERWKMVGYIENTRNGAQNIRSKYGESGA